MEGVAETAVLVQQAHAAHDSKLATPASASTSTPITASAAGLLLDEQQQQQQQQQLLGHATKDFLAGAISGMVGIVAGQPLDTLRIRLQQRTCQQASASALARAMGASEGWRRGLFRGMSYPLVTTGLQNAVCFQAQGAAARMLTGSDSRATPALGGGGASWQHTCLSGMFAGAVSSFVTSPVELLKIRMQLQAALPGSAEYLGPVSMLRHVLQQEGPRGLVRGLGITLARDTPSYGFYFCIYAWCCQGLGQLAAQWPTPSTASAAAADAAGSVTQPPPQQQQQQVVEAATGAASVGPLVQFLAGGLAGALAWMSIYPIDVVKSRMQALPRAASPYRSAWHCAAASWSEAGPRVFVKGLGATMGRGFLVNATIFAAFEAAMKALDG